MENIMGYMGALIVGLTLGLLGGGGSILTVPLMVYVIGVNPVTATAYSLFVVGGTSLVGAVRNMTKGMVDIKVAVVFAIPALLAVYLTRRYLVPAIPPEIFHIGGFVLTKDLGIMLFFAVIMVLASVSMIKVGKSEEQAEKKVKLQLPFIVLEGAVVGVLTGIVGAGGGFLVIPALVLFANLPMKKAVATSLLIIAAKSLIGFIGDVQNLAISWTFLLTFTAISVAGIFLGIYLNRFIDEKPLKKAFGWFVLVMGVFIIGKELLKF
jgi:uncharacterized protein